MWILRAFEATVLYSGKNMNDVLKKYIIISSSCPQATIALVKKKKSGEKILEVKDMNCEVIIDGNKV